MSAPSPKTREQSSQELFLLGLLATCLPVALSLFSGFQKRAYDSNIHMFFASHYVRGWFDLWEPRWYGGFAVTSYPPLTHQLIAALSFPFGLENAYIIVTAAVMLAMPFAVRSAALAFTDEDTAALALLIAPLWPTAERFAYVYGQLAMLTATPLALFSMGRLNRFLKSGNPLHLLTYLALVGATAGAHHISTLLAAGGAMLVALRHILLVGSPLKAESRRAFLRLAGLGLLAGALSAATIYFVIYPFWKFAAGAPQVEIPHLSRLAIWERPFGLDVVEQVVTLVLAPVLIICAIKKGELSMLFLGLGVLFLAVISLGATTPLPRIIFRSQWRWLTYDKFYYWASLLFVIGIAWFMTAFGKSGRKSQALVALVLLPTSVFFVGFKSSDAYQPEFIDDIQPMVKILTTAGAERFRHLTVGFGDQFCRLDVLSNSPNLDGDYHTARNNPVLRASGIATLDAAKYYDAGAATLGEILSHARSDGLRWVFAADRWYEKLLFEAGFEIKEVWSNGVVLFEMEDATPLPPEVKPPRTVGSYLWGLLPMSCLGVALLTALLSLLLERGARGAAGRAAARRPAPG